jgi:uncharacterized protein
MCFIQFPHQKQEFIPFNRWEKCLGVSYLPQLQFYDRLTKEKIQKICRKSEKKNTISLQQKWQGALFSREIESAFIPPLELRWIAASIGFGVFALQALQARQYVCQYTGYLRKKRFFEEPFNAYCFEYSIEKGDRTSLFIDAEQGGNLARFINHSDRPNLEPILVYHKELFHVILLTKRVILAGEQLVYDYGNIYWKKRPDPYLF